MCINIGLLHNYPAFFSNVNKYRNPVYIDKTLYVFERLIIGASFLYFIHILSFLLRKNIFTNIELSKAP